MTFDIGPGIETALQARLAVEAVQQAMAPRLGDEEEKARALKAALTDYFHTLDPLLAGINAQPEAYARLPAPLNREIFLGVALQGDCPPGLRVSLWRELGRQAPTDPAPATPEAYRLQILEVLDKAASVAQENGLPRVADGLWAEAIERGALLLREGTANPCLGAYGQAEAYYRWRGDVLDAGSMPEKADPQIRSWLLSLHLNNDDAAFGLEDYQKTEACWRQGVMAGRTFITAGDMAWEEPIKGGRTLLLRVGTFEPRLRRIILSLYLNAGINAYVSLKTYHLAEECWRRGIQRGEEFIAAGETDTEVRGTLLTLCNNAGGVSRDLGNPQQADVYYARGIRLGEELIAAGETDPEVRLRLLDLCLKAGVVANRDLDNPQQADAYYARGIRLGEEFIAAGETDPEVRRVVLRLYNNAGYAAGRDLNDAQKEDASYAQGIQLGEKFIAAGETDPEVRLRLLDLCLKAGVVANRDLDNPQQADAYCARGIRLGEKFIAAGEANLEVRRTLLKLCFNAGLVAANELGNIQQAEAYLTRGIRLGEAFIAAGETDPEVRLRLLDLCRNAGVVAERQGAISRKQHYQTRQLAHRWHLGRWDREQLQKQLAKSTEDVNSEIEAFDKGCETARDHVSRLDLFDFELHWERFTTHALLAWHHPETPYRPAYLRKLQTWSRILLLWEWGERNQALAQRWQALERLLVAGQAQLAPGHWSGYHALETPVELRQALERLSGGSCPAMAPLSELKRRYQATSWWRHLWRPLSSLTAWEGLFPRGAAPVASEALWQEIAREQHRLAHWLAQRLGEEKALPEGLGEAGAIGLGLLLAAAPETPEAELAHWRRHPPWSTPERLQEALSRTHPERWTRFEKGQRAGISVWARQVSAKRLRIHPSVDEDQVLKATLSEALEAFDAGEAQALQALLHQAWGQVETQASPLAELLEEFTGQPSHQEARVALVLGETLPVLRHAIKGWLARRHPWERESPLPRVLTGLKARFGTALERYPVPAHSDQVAQFLHGFAQQAIAQAFEGATQGHAPDLEGLWESLEVGRSALSGLGVTPPGLKWTRALMEELRELIKTTPDGVEGRTETLWPPLARWLEKAGAQLPALPAVARIQQRLRPGEALVQPFFARESGPLYALWLKQKGPLTLHCLSEAGADQWQPLLKNWAQATAKPRPARLARTWQNILAQGEVPAVAGRLRDWAQAAGCPHLVVIFPAELGQLPWEALESFQGDDLCLERVVSLSQWREHQQPPAANVTPSASLPAAVLHAQDTKGLRYGPEEGRQASRYYGVPAYGPPQGQVGVADVLWALGRARRGHLIMHGHYTPLEARDSYLEVNAEEHLPVWALVAAGVAGEQWGLSACESALSGRDRRPLLGPVGIGPSLLVAGARRVWGSLWPVDAAASLVFHRLLYGLAEAEPRCAWPALMARAKAQLRTLTLEEVEALLGPVFAEQPEALEALVQSLRGRGTRPFAELFYWAPFTLLGETGRDGVAQTVPLVARDEETEDLGPLETVAG